MPDRSGPHHQRTPAGARCQAFTRQSERRHRIERSLVDPSRFVTVTKLRSGVEVPVVRRCAWCARRLPAPARTGRPRAYCRRSCRQRAFEARQRNDDLAWGDDRLKDATARMDDLHVTLAGIGDLVDEMLRDVEDGRTWDDDMRDEQVRRLAALLATSQ